MEKSPAIVSCASIVGGKEGNGPLGKYFDSVIEDSHFGEKTWEKAESKFQLEAVCAAIRKANLTKEDLDVICAVQARFEETAEKYGIGLAKDSSK